MESLPSVTMVVLKYMGSDAASSTSADCTLVVRGEFFTFLGGSWRIRRAGTCCCFVLLLLEADVVDVVAAVLLMGRFRDDMIDWPEKEKLFR